MVQQLGDVTLEQIGILDTGAGQLQMDDERETASNTISARA